MTGTRVRWKVGGDYLGYKNAINSKVFGDYINEIAANIAANDTLKFFQK